MDAAAAEPPASPHAAAALAVLGAEARAQPEPEPEQLFEKLCSTCRQCTCLHEEGNYPVIMGQLPPSTPGTPPRQLQRASSAVQLDSAKKRIRDLQLQQKDSEGNARVVDSEIRAKDLSATWGDQQIYGPEDDWRKEHEGHTSECDVCRGIPDLWRTCLVASPSFEKFSAARKERSLRKTAKRRRKRMLAQDTAGAPIQIDSKSDEDDEDDDGADADDTVSSLNTKDRMSSLSNLSKGAHGEVLRAQWKKTIKVAIKKNLSQKSNEDEMRLFRDLNHPNIVICYGFLREGTTMSIVTERCTTSLDAFLKDNRNWERFHDEPLTPDKIDFRKLTILEHVAAGLEKLHDHCVLHRDIKTSNILLDGEPGTCETCDHEGRWKICDFGEATILKTPTLAFDPPRVWRGSIEVHRWQPITSVELNTAGAHHYCWLHPGETFRSVSTEDAGWAVAVEKSLKRLDLQALKSRALELQVPEEWVLKAEHPEELIPIIMNPFPNGALIYSFSEEKNVPHERDCVFKVSGVATQEEPDPKPFPAALRPFALIPWTELKGEELRRRVTVDLAESSYSIDTSWEGLPPQLTCLKNLYPQGVNGKISTLYEIPKPKESSSLTLNVTRSRSVEQPMETEYHESLPQEHNGKMLPPDKAQWCCDKTKQRLGDGTDQTASLWLNLSDGFIGGGRKYWDGTGGNNTAIDHYEEMKKEGKHYPLAVKLGTITADGAEVYSYAPEEDDLVSIPLERLKELLAHWGIDTAHMEKTESGMQDLEMAELEEALRRRRHRVPMNATHYVFAYQLDPWIAGENFKHLDTLRQHSGEMSLASYGGFIYLSMESETPSVVGITAFSTVPSQARPAFEGGVITRTDERVSAHVASPELWDGVDVGLETDIYAFGIVMWEVFTRRDAWHWVGKEQKQFQILKRVADEMQRPKMPLGLSNHHPLQGEDSPCEFLRKCLHHDPCRRPKAHELSAWLKKCREVIHREMQVERDAVVRELRSSNSQKRWSLVDLTDPAVKLRWCRGLYSLHSVKLHKQSAVLKLTVNAQTRDEWEESALTGDDRRPAQLEATNQTLQLEPLGLIFQWPKVVKIERRTKDASKTRTLASQHPDLQETRGCDIVTINGLPVHVEAAFSTDEELGLIFNTTTVAVKRIKPGCAAAAVPGLIVGCKLLTVNGESIDGKAYDDVKPAIANWMKLSAEEKEAAPLTMTFLSPQENFDVELSKRPLELEFRIKPPDSLDVVVEPWHRSGLQAVGMVQAHEERSKQLSAMASDQLGAADPAHGAANAATESPVDIAQVELKLRMAQQGVEAKLREGLSLVKKAQSHQPGDAAAATTAADALDSSRETELRQLLVRKDAEIATLRAELEAFKAAQTEPADGAILVEPEPEPEPAT